MAIDMGRSGGGLSTKIHQFVDGHGLPLVVRISPGQAGDAPMLPALMDGLRVARPAGRPRTRPDRLRGDKAYSSRAIRSHLRRRGITAVIPEPRDQAGHRRRRGSRRGRPPAFDAADYRGRNVVERRYCHLKQWRGPATRYDKHALPPTPQTRCPRPLDPHRVRGHHDHTSSPGCLTRPVTYPCSSPN